MYLREQEEGNLERATMMDRLASRALRVGARAGPCAHAPRAGLKSKAAPARSEGGLGPGQLAPRKLTPPPAYPTQSLAKLPSRGILRHVSPSRV